MGCAPPPAARGKSPDRPCARDLASAGKARGGGDARASSTTSNAVRRQTPGALRVAGGADPSALLRLLDDAWASPASPRLASGPAAPATRPIRLLPRAARGFDFLQDFTSGWLLRQSSPGHGRHRGCPPFHSSPHDRRTRISVPRSCSWEAPPSRVVHRWSGRRW